MSETAPASDMLVDNNRTNNAAVGQTIRFHGRHNGQIVIARQHPKAANRTIASAIHASTGKIALPFRKIAPFKTQPTSQKFRQASFLLLALFQGIHQHELKMNNHLRLHSAPIAYSNLIKQIMIDQLDPTFISPLTLATQIRQRTHPMGILCPNQSHPFFAAWKLLTALSGAFPFSAS